MQDYRQQGLSQQTRRDFGRAIPIVGPAFEKAKQQEEAGNEAGAAGTVFGLASGMVAPAALSEVRLPSATEAITAPLRSGLDEPIAPGTTTTPRVRYQAAKRVGVQLDAADATNSPTLRMAKAVNQHSLLGSSAYDAAKMKNLAGLQGNTDALLNGMYAGDRESGGAAIQTALRQHQQGLQTAATEGFRSLPRDLPIAAAENVGKEAQAIRAEVEPYQERYPSMVPRQTMGIVNDVSKLSPELPRGVQGPLQQARGVNFGELQQLRSDLLESGRTNPDLVKNQSGGWLKRLSGATDSAMTDAANGLTPEEQEAFRKANANWNDMKSTYDDPSSALYHAVRTDAPSTLYNGGSLGPKTPEAVRDLMPRLGQTSANLAPNALGALRRGTVEAALKSTNEGAPNFKTFGTQLNRVPADYRAELFTEPQNQRLRDIASTANVLGQDLNPSGTAKLGQKITDFHAMVPAALYELGRGNVGTAAVTASAPLLHYPLSRLINSPRFTEFLMREAGHQGANGFTSLKVLPWPLSRPDLGSEQKRPASGLWPIPNTDVTQGFSTSPGTLAARPDLLQRPMQVPWKLSRKLAARPSR